MIKPFFLLAVVLAAFALQAQTPGNIVVKGKLGVRTIQPRMACMNQAGTVRFGPFTGQSNSITNKLVFLCYNDSLQVIHNGDGNLGGDPDGFSPAGIRYALYDCLPTVTGPTLSAILGDSCLNKTSPIIVNGQPVNQSKGIWITTDGTPGGNLTLFNRGQYQSAYNGGKPVAFWFAPITIDDFANSAYEPDPTTGEAGACVNVNPDAAFQVVYLNPIAESNINTSLNGQGCQGSFVARGGLPEFDSLASYSVRIFLTSDPGVTGRVLTTGVLGHGDSIRFFVPQPGSYTVIAEDGKSCEARFSVNMSGCNAVTFSLPFLNARPADSVCVDLTAQGFTNVGALEMDFAWDTTVIQFTGVRNYNAKMNGLGPGSTSLTGTSRLNLSWLDPTFTGVTLNSGESVFQLCFVVTGDFGQSSPLQILPSAIPEETVGTPEPRPLGFILNSGQINVSADVLFLDLEQDSVSCDGGANGAFTITVANGVPPYAISWRSIPPLPADSGTGTIPASGGMLTIPSRPAGRYQVQVRDAQTPAPNTAIDTVEVLQPPILAVRMIEKDPSCFGYSDGSIRAEILIDAVPQPNPGPEYVFRWSVPGITADRLDSIPGGFYAVTVTNAAGCSSEASTNLSQPAPIVLNPVITNATCSGVADGSIVLNASGGFTSTSGRYTFSWLVNGAPVTTQGTSSTLTSLGSGEYCVTVSDDNGCEIQRCFSVGARKILSVDSLMTQVTCNGLCDGAITVNGNTAGAVPALPYTFAWTGNVPGAPVNTNTSSSIADLCAGMFVVTMRDSDPLGCQVTDTLFIREPEPLDVALVELVNESCIVGNDGRAAVSVSGGTGPYRLIWSNGQTDSVATNLSAGDYELRVLDNNDCETLFPVTIIAPTPPQIVSLPNDTLNCSSDTNGQLQVAAAEGGAAIIAYEWSNGATGTAISGLSPGEYILTILAADGCRTIDTAQIVAPAALRIDSTQVQSPRCPGEATGQAIISPGGGTGPYTYIWAAAPDSDTTFFPLRPGLTAGTFAFTVTDANNCPGVSGSIQVSDPPGIQVQYSDTTAVSCFEDVCDGALTATAGYSNGATGRFEFFWSSGEMLANTNSSRALQLCGGENSLIVVDSNFCRFTDTLSIPSPEEIQIGFIAEPVRCNGGADGQIAVQVSGGTPNYNYLWLETGGVTPQISNLPAGTYTIRITDGNNCPKEAPFALREPAALTLSIDPANTNNARCNGGREGRIAVLVNTQDSINPLGPNPFTWLDGVAPSNSAEAVKLRAGDYSVTVTDSKGCQDTLNYSILEPEPIVAMIVPPLEPRCFGESTTLNIDTIYGGNGSSLLDYTFMVNNSGLSFPPNQPATIFAGDVLVTIEDPLGCTYTDTLTVNQPEELTVTFDPSEIVVELGDSTTTLDPILTASLPIDSFIWSPREFLSSASIQNPLVINLLDDQEFSLTVVDVNGCTAAGKVFVELDRNRNVYIPNIFSPNGDGRNDEFRLFACKGVTRVNFARVFDRWGDQIFESQAIGPDCLSGAPLWDGKVRGDKAPAGVYVYLIEIEFLDNVTLLYRGDVTVIR
ncbi:MAG: hypothetical protein KIPDCIKN_01136 [Haliscomenobacter sp.]|jgi:gliding motility-associated-like protein|nr:hypothetical protein [Haliscomenobacter sp.]